MGHRPNGLPLLHLVPGQFVIENKLKRIHHHSLKPYSDSEAVRLLKNEWSVHDPKGCYSTALDECYSLALLGPGPERPLSDATLEVADFTVEPCDITDSRFLVTDSKPLRVPDYQLPSSSEAHREAVYSVSQAPRVTSGSMSLGLVCSGLVSELFFSDSSGESFALPLTLRVVIESKPDLQAFAYTQSQLRGNDTIVYNDLRDVVRQLETGVLSRDEVYTDIVGGTSPCYRETTMSLYNDNAIPHEDGDLFDDFQVRYVAVVRPKVFLAEMTPPHSKSSDTDSHGTLLTRLKELGYHINVTDRVPSCFCGDYTHRDRWFAIAFDTPGPPFSILGYCTSEPLPAIDILDPVDRVSPHLTVTEHVTFRSRGDDTHPWGSDYANDPSVAGQYISRSDVVGYVNGSHDKEDKVYSIHTTLPCITRYGVQIKDERLGPNVVRFCSLAELCRASSLTPTQFRHL